MGARRVARRHRTGPDIIDDRESGIGVKAQAGQREAQVAGLILALQDPEVLLSCLFSYLTLQ